MSDSVEASNALVSLVQFYSQALGEERLARLNAEGALRRLATRNPDPYPERDALINVARMIAANVLGGEDRLSRVLCEALTKASDDYDRSKVDRVEPPDPHPGSVRGARADGPADVPGADRRG